MRRTLTAVLATVAATTLVAGLMGAVSTSASAQTKPAPVVSGWFGWWVSEAQAQRLVNESAGVIDEVNIFWFTFAGADNPVCLIDAARGVCVPSSTNVWTAPRYDRVRTILQNGGIKVLGSITDLGATYAGQLSPFLADPANRRAYARQIARYAQNAGLDGIDLDWENFAFRDRNLGVSWAETRPRWIAMIKRLHRELNDRGLILSVTVPGGQQYWGGSTGVYALKEIIDHSDRVRFMTYDFSWSSPGPIGPTRWARAQLEAAIAEVGPSNASKLWVGNPQYGREWALNKGTTSAPVYGTNANCPRGWTPGFYNTSGAWVSTIMRTMATPDGARAVAQANNVEPQWNSTHGEWTFRYSPRVNGRFSSGGSFVERECRVDREVWFGDTRSALVDAQMIPELGIGGMAVWNFGSVQSNFYTRMAAFGREIAEAQTRMNVKVSATVPYGRNARLDITTSSDKGPAAGAQATIRWSPTNERSAATEVATATLNARGAATVRVPVERTGFFWVDLAPSDGHSSAQAGPLRTRVSWRVTPGERDVTAVAGETTRLSGEIAPQRGGVTIRLQRQTDSGWRNLRRVTTDDSGQFAGNVRVLRPQTATYRFVAVASDGLIRGISPQITLRVTAS